MALPVLVLQWLTRFICAIKPSVFCGKIQLCGNTTIAKVGLEGNQSKHRWCYFSLAIL